MDGFMSIYALPFLGNDKPKNLRLWLDATDPYGNGTSVPSNTTLSTWADKSTYKNNATALTKTNTSATITYERTGFNSNYPTFSFDGGGNRFKGELPTSNLSNISGQNMRVFFVGTGNNGRVISFSDTYLAPDFNSSKRWLFANVVTNQNAMGPYRNNISLTTLPPASTASLPTIWQAWFVDKIANAKYFENGTVKSSNVSNDSFTSFDIQHYAIGSNTDGSDLYGWFNGKISEILVYNSTLTNSEVEKIEGYLAHKWGLQSRLPSNHAYKTSGPDSQIITEITKL